MRKVIRKIKIGLKLLITGNFRAIYLALQKNLSFLKIPKLNFPFLKQFIKAKIALKLLIKGDFRALYLGLNSTIFRFNDIHNISVPKFEGASSTPLTFNQPIVSVVIPCYNYGKFIEEAVDSVLNQTIKNLEILIIDGGSTDGYTTQFLRNFNRPKTNIFIREGRHYVGDNRNFGISKARGKYICCLDADDTLEPTYLEKSIFFLETYGFDITSTATKFMGNREGYCDILERPTLADEIRGNHVLTCGVFRKDLWSEVGGFFDFGIGKDHVAEDWEFWVRAFARGARVRNLSGEYLFNYRIHEGAGSLSSDKAVRGVEHQKKIILNKNKKLINKLSIKNSYLKNSKYLRCPPSSAALANAINFQHDLFLKTIIIFVPYFMVGGAERLLSGLCKHLSLAQWRVILVSTNDYDDSFGSSRQWFAEWTSELYELPKFLKKYEYLDFVESLMISRSPDFIINAGSEFLYDSLDFLSENYADPCYVDLLFNTVGHVVSHIRFKNNFQMAFCESDEVFEWFINNGWPVSKVKKLLSGVDLDALVPIECKPLLPNLLISANEFVVGFSGRLSVEKAPDIFLEIAKLSGSTNLHFVMTGSGPMESDLVREIDTLLPNIKFTYLGLVDEVSKYVASYDVLVLPSRIDGRPLIVMEALALGVPVIASNVGGLPNLVIDGVNGYLLKELNPSGFYNKIQLLASCKESHLKMKKNARLFAENNLDSNKAYKAYELALLEAAVANTSN